MAPFSAGQRWQAPFWRGTLREGAKIGNMGDLAFAVIGPVVIHAAEVFGGSQPLGPEPVAAVQTHIGEGPHRTVRLPHDDNGFAADIGADIIARLLDVVGASAKQPDLAPDFLPLPLHEVG